MFLLLSRKLFGCNYFIHLFNILNLILNHFQATDISTETPLVTYVTHTSDNIETLF